MVSLVMQSAIVSLIKGGKTSKASSSLNSPFAEEEESHSEKDASDEVLLFSEDHFLIQKLQLAGTIVWQNTEPACTFHSSEILIPPPKI